MQQTLRADSTPFPVTHQSPITIPNVPKCPKMSDLGRLSQLGGLVETNRTIFHRPTTQNPRSLTQDERPMQIGVNNFHRRCAIRCAAVAFQSPINASLPQPSNL